MWGYIQSIECHDDLNEVKARVWVWFPDKETAEYTQGSEYDHIVDYVNKAYPDGSMVIQPVPLKCWEGNEDGCHVVVKSIIPLRVEVHDKVNARDLL